MNLEPFPYEYSLVGHPPYRLKWPDVFKIFRENEEDLEHWKKYYQSQGFKSWEEWRERFFQRFGMRHLSWDLYEIVTPNAVRSLRGADFRGWRKLTGQKHLRFWEMAQLKSIQEYEPLRSRMDNFPKETTIIGIRYNECIFVIEGMHRCATYALALSEGKEIKTKIKIALGRKDNLIRPLFLGARI